MTRALAIIAALHATHKGGRMADDKLSVCDLGVGCDETGTCYALAHDKPEICGRESLENRLDDKSEAIRLAHAIGMTAEEFTTVGDEIVEALARHRIAITNTLLGQDRAKRDAAIEGLILAKSALERGTHQDFQDETYQELDALLKELRP